MNWSQAVAKIAPYIVKIETPEGEGTGFICFYTQDKKACGIATAKHVIEYAHKWHLPIRILNHELKEAAFLEQASRVFAAVDTVGNSDSTIIFCPLGSILLQEPLISLLPRETVLSIGTEIGWLGFPAVAPNTLCFFSGSISAGKLGDGTYLVDGVAIHGVSGGPTFLVTETGDIQIVGVITAYLPNQATSYTLPGLSIIQDLSHLLEEIDVMRSMEEITKARQKIEKSNGPVKINP